MFFLPATIIIIGRNGNKKDSLSWQLLLCSSALENFLSLKTRFHARKCKYKGGLVDVGTKCIRARIGPPNFYNCIHYLKKKSLTFYPFEKLNFVLLRNCNKNSMESSILCTEEHSAHSSKLMMQNLKVTNGTLYNWKLII